MTNLTYTVNAASLFDVQTEKWEFLKSIDRSAAKKAALLFIARKVNAGHGDVRTINDQTMVVIPAAGENGIITYAFVTAHS